MFPEAFIKNFEEECVPRFSPNHHTTDLLSPMWTCSAPKGQHHPRATSNTTIAVNHKLVFVHVFKTAGMTIRELFFGTSLRVMPESGWYPTVRGLCRTKKKQQRVPTIGGGGGPMDLEAKRGNDVK